MRLKLVSMIGAVLVSAAMAGAAHAEPPIWVVKDADSTIYLFGTVHILRPETNWRTPRIDQALGQATELWMEIVQPKDPAQLQAIITPLMAQHGLSPDKPLSSRLKPDDYKRLEQAIVAMKMPGLEMQMVNLMRPWLVATLLSAGPLVAAGYDTEAGVETVLEKAATAQGDQVRSFEKIEQQLTFLATLPDDVQLQFLLDTLNENDVADMDKLVAAWVAADLPAIERDFMKMKAEAPQLYEVLLIRRNEDWAGQIQERLKGSGVSFMAVGAAHLIGPDSVQTKLKARGIDSSRF